MNRFRVVWATVGGPRLHIATSHDRYGRLPPDRWRPPAVTGVMIQSIAVTGLMIQIHIIQSYIKDTNRFT